MNEGKRNRGIPTLVLIVIVLASLWWDYYEDGPGIVTGVNFVIAPILAGAIFAGIVPKFPVKFGLSLAAIGFVFAFVSVPMTWIFIASLGTAGLWFVLFVPIAVLSLFAIAYGLLMALFGAIFTKAISFASNKPTSPPLARD